MKYTKHAQIRLKQRGISQDVVNFILTYGQYIDSYGETKHFVNSNALKFLSTEYASFVKKYEKQLRSTAIVCKEDVVITAMKITKKIRIGYAH